MHYSLNVNKLRARKPLCKVDRMCFTQLMPCQFQQCLRKSILPMKIS